MYTRHLTVERQLAKILILTAMLGDITTAAINIFADVTVPVKIARMNQLPRKR